MDALTINTSLSRHKLPPRLTTPPPFSRHFHLHFRPPHRLTTLTITTTSAATVENPPQFSDYNEEETYGEVKSIIGSRALEDNTGTVEFVDREVKSLKRSKIVLVQFRLDSKRGPEFTREHKD
ncbi:hypothetical protein Tco_0102739 [Tanacetum coccineum]